MFRYLAVLALVAASARASTMDEEVQQQPSLDNHDEYSAHRNLQDLITMPDFDATDESLNGINIPNNAADVGMWTNLVDWPIVSIHSAVLPNGKLISHGKFSI